MKGSDFLCFLLKVVKNPYYRMRVFHFGFEVLSLKKIIDSIREVCLDNDCKLTSLDFHSIVRGALAESDWVDMRLIEIACEVDR